MRILCFTNLFPNQLQPNKGIYNWRSFMGLQRMDADLRVISPILLVDELRSRWKRGAFLSSRLWTEWDGLNVVYPCYYYTPWVLRRYYGRFMYASVRNAFRAAVASFRPDLVFATWAYPDGWAACQLAREFDLPVVVKVHGSDLLCLDQYPARRRGTIETLQEADAIVAVSRDLRNRAIALGASTERTHTIYTGTDAELFSRGDRALARRGLELPAEGVRLLFVGNLVPVKGIDLLIEACHRLASRGITVALDILGEGPLRHRLQQQIESLGLTGTVRLRGSIPQKELPQWYRAADVVVLSSHSEGVPNVLVEAAACGIPFVATAVGGIPEIAQLTSAPLVRPGDSVALADGIAALLADPQAMRFQAEQSLIPSTIDSAALKMRQFLQLVADRYELKSELKYLPLTTL